MEAKPLQTVPFSPNTSVDEGKRVIVLKEENSSSSTLISSHKCCLFTEAQRCELDHQVFIFNHFAFNLPLPHHLLQFQTNMSEYKNVGFDYGTMGYPEPHRCRRTDGKKWRCSKNTVPDQKYCERHMHRGRNRSRKLVETSQLNSPLTTRPCDKKSHSNRAPNTNAVSNPNPLAIQPSDTSSYTPSRNLCVVDNSSANNRLRNVIGSKNYATPVTPCSTLPTAVSPNMATSGNMVSNDKSHTKDYQTNRCISNIMSVKSGGKGSILCDTNGNDTGIGFSPKSVLQVSGCNNSCLNDRNSIVEPEPGRCRRTDGKKWRCKGAVLLGQKYCATHMHRGAKKRCTNQEPSMTTTVTTSSAIPVARLPYPSAATSIQKMHCRIPNTKVSISVPESAPLIQCEEKCASSSDTDTSTTITDTMDECSYVSF